MELIELIERGIDRLMHSKRDEDPRTMKKEFNMMKKEIDHIKSQISVKREKSSSSDRTMQA